MYWLQFLAGFFDKKETKIVYDMMYMPSISKDSYRIHETFHTLDYEIGIGFCISVALGFFQEINKHSLYFTLFLVTLKSL